MPAAGLPAYAGMLAARHAAHAAELRAIVDSLPLPAGGAVLEVCCGDGFASGLFRQRGVAGRVAAFDLSPDLAAWARDRAAEDGSERGVAFAAADVERMPFADASFDLVWCGQNLMTLRGSADALREMRRVLKPAGTLAVLENDRLHELRLPWPPELELAVHAALAAGAEDGDAAPLKIGCVGRRVGELLAEAGFAVTHRRTCPVDRRGPFAPADRAFLEAYLHDLGRSVRPHLSDADRAAFDRLTPAGQPDSLIDGDGAWLTWTDSLWLATPAG